METSVVIAVRNGERFLGKAIDSVLAQISETDELIVVDDGSTDDSAKIAATSGDGRVKLIGLGRSGVSAARNQGLAAATGRFLAFLDHDDLWPPGRHRMLIEALYRNPSAGSAYGRIRVIEEVDAPKPGLWSHLDAQHMESNICSALYRTECVRGSGGFSEAMLLGEDTDLQLRLMRLGLNPMRCDGDSLIYRRHGSNATNDIAAVNRALIAVARRVSEAKQTYNRKGGV